MKAWITKYALSTGMYEAEVERRGHDGMVLQKGNPSKGTYDQFFSKPHWHESRASAIAQVRKMIAAKRRSIQKQLDKLAKLEATLQEKPPATTPKTSPIPDLWGDTLDMFDKKEPK